jgi:hypothetical protein
MFFQCPFEKNCWRIVGVNVPTWLKLERATRHINRLLRLPFAMEIIIVMCWCIWTDEMTVFLMERIPELTSASKTSGKNSPWLSIG